MFTPTFLYYQTLNYMSNMSTWGVNASAYCAGGLPQASPKEKRLQVVVIMLSFDNLQ